MTIKDAKLHVEIDQDIDLIVFLPMEPEDGRVVCSLSASQDSFSTCIHLGKTKKKMDQFTTALRKTQDHDFNDNGLLPQYEEIGL